MQANAMRRCLGPVRLPACSNSVKLRLCYRHTTQQRPRNNLQATAAASDQQGAPEATATSTVGMQQCTITIATRGSKLAMKQSQQVADLLRAHGAAHGQPVEVKLLVVATRGPILTMRELGPGAFTAELDEAVQQGDAVLAVHSLKDAPPVAPYGLRLAACLPREDPRDVLLIRGTTPVTSLADLPAGTVLGTASSRRKAQVLACNPKVKVVPMRGNVDSRVMQLQQGTADATLLAMAGIKRLGNSLHCIANVQYAALPVSEMMPAGCQGVVGIIARETTDPTLTHLLDSLCDRAALLEAVAERSVLAELMVQKQPGSTEVVLAMPEHAVGVLARAMWNSSTSNQPVETSGTSGHGVPGEQSHRQCTVHVQAMVADINGLWIHRIQSQTELEVQGRQLGGAVWEDGLKKVETMGRDLGQQLLALGAQH